jgi:Protein of unknown function, DUF481
MLRRSLLLLLLAASPALAQFDMQMMAPPMQPLMPVAFQQPQPIASPADAFFLDAPAPPAKLYKGSLDAGLNGATGNSETLNIRFFASADRTDADNLLHTDLTYLLGKQNGKTIQNTMIANLRDEILFAGSPWTLYSANFFDYDEQRQYKLLIGLYGGLGFRVFDDETLQFKLRGGAGSLYKTEAPAPLKDVWEASLNFGWDYRYQVSQRAAIVSTLDYYPTITDFNKYLVRFRLAYEQTVDPETGAFFRIGLFERYDSNPGPGTNRSDLAYFLAFGFNL